MERGFKKASTLWKGIVFGTLVTFLLSFVMIDLLRIEITQASVLELPEPTELLKLSDAYSLPIIKGLKLNENDPLQISFIADAGDKKEIVEFEAERLINYFLATLTIPEEQLWVNLSPYENDRIMEEKLSWTDLGKELLSQDYVLKQFVSSVTHPESDLGKEYWGKTYDKVLELTGSSRMAINTFNKVWIVPGEIKVLENGYTAIVSKAELKAMMEEDYLAREQNKDEIVRNASTIDSDSIEDVSKVSSEVMRNVVLPKIEEEINNGKHFARLRQVYHSLILAQWFKNKFKESFYKHYFDKAKIEGIDLEDKELKDKVFTLYTEAFQKGVYDYIGKVYDKSSGEKLKRRYFSGGIKGASSALVMQSTQTVDLNEIENLIVKSGDYYEIDGNLINTGSAEDNFNSLKKGIKSNLKSEISEEELDNIVSLISDSLENDKVSEAKSYAEFLNANKNQISDSKQAAVEMVLAELEDFINPKELSTVNEYAKGEEISISQEQAIKLIQQAVIANEVNQIKRPGSQEDVKLSMMNRESIEQALPSALMVDVSNGETGYTRLEIGQNFDGSVRLFVRDRVDNKAEINKALAQGNIQDFQEEFASAEARLMNKIVNSQEVKAEIFDSQEGLELKEQIDNLRELANETGDAKQIQEVDMFLAASKERFKDAIATARQRQASEKLELEGAEAIDYLRTELGNKLDENLTNKANAGFNYLKQEFANAIDDIEGTNQHLRELEEPAWKSMMPTQADFQKQESAEDVVLDKLEIVKNIAVDFENTARNSGNLEAVEITFQVAMMDIANAIDQYGIARINPDLDFYIRATIDTINSDVEMAKANAQRQNTAQASQDVDSYISTLPMADAMVAAQAFDELSQELGREATLPELRNKISEVAQSATVVSSALSEKRVDVLTGAAMYENFMNEDSMIDLKLSELKSTVIRSGWNSAAAQEKLAQIELEFMGGTKASPANKSYEGLRQLSEMLKKDNADNQLATLAIHQHIINEYLAVETQDNLSEVELEQVSSKREWYAEQDKIKNAWAGENAEAQRNSGQRRLAADQSLNNGLDSVFSEGLALTNEELGIASQNKNSADPWANVRNKGIGSSALSKNDQDKLGGIDLANLNIEVDGASSPLAFIPFDIENFRGFKVAIAKIQKIESKDKVLSML